MYRCGKCGQLSRPGEPAEHSITETRTKTYPYREFAIREGRGPKKRWIADAGGIGFETVSERLVHTVCHTAD